MLYVHSIFLFLFPPMSFPSSLFHVTRFQSDKKGGSDGDPSIGGTLNRSFGGDEPPTTGNVQQEHVETYVKVWEPHEWCGMRACVCVCVCASNSVRWWVLWLHDVGCLYGLFDMGLLMGVGGVEYLA